MKITYTKKKKNIIGVQIHIIIVKFFTTKLPITVPYKTSITLWVSMKGPILFCVRTSGLVSGSHDQLQPADKEMKSDSVGTAALFPGLCPKSTDVGRMPGSYKAMNIEYGSSATMRDRVYDNYTMYIGH